MRLKYFFHQDPTTGTTDSTEEDNTTSYPSSGWTSPSGQDPFLESYRSTIIYNTLKEIKRKNNRKFKRNLKKELIVINTLRNSKNKVIKPADKGGNIFYIKEGLRQLSHQNHYEILEEDPTQNYINEIYKVLQQAVKLDIIADKMKKTLYNKAPRTPNFYILPKIHKPNNPEDLL